MDLTTFIYQHVMAALLATSGASAVIGWLTHHWRLIGRTWNGAVAVAGWVRKLGPAPTAVPDLAAILNNPEALAAIGKALKDAQAKAPSNLP